jgi:hypothetical protein
VKTSRSSSEVRAGFEVRTVATPVGDARVDVRRAKGRRRATLVLGHGAGGGIGAPDLVALADIVVERDH